MEAWDFSSECLDNCNYIKHKLTPQELTRISKNLGSKDWQGDDVSKLEELRRHAVELKIHEVFTEACFKFLDTNRDKFKIIQLHRLRKGESY
mmetsp:Transcript_31631/g.54763  ORF Transcript_31631/g.54763 Transcript_31631/m.54763 type:complete len:92 (-) Transcript_31631:104-379(-)